MPSTRSRCLPLVLLLVSGIAPAGRAAEPAVNTVVLPDPDAKPKYHCWEPHVAVDPDQPDRVVVAAMYRGQIGEGEKARGDCTLFAWRSEDAGRKWSTPAAPFVTADRPAGCLGADTVLAFGANKTCWFSGCDYDWKVPGTPSYSSIKVARSDDGGKTWAAPLAVTELDNVKTGKGLLDKQWVAVDRGGGKRAGTVYVAWTRIDDAAGQLELRCAALPPGGKAFTAGVPLADPIPLKHLQDAVHQVQLAVRPDGTLDAVWRRGDDANRIVHSLSTDGGATFSKPQPISADEKRGGGPVPGPDRDRGRPAAGGVGERGRRVRRRPLGGEMVGRHAAGRRAARRGTAVAPGGRPHGGRGVGAGVPPREDPGPRAGGAVPLGRPRPDVGEVRRRGEPGSDRGETGGQPR